MTTKTKTKTRKKTNARRPLVKKTTARAGPKKIKTAAKKNVKTEEKKEIIQTAPGRNNSGKTAKPIKLTKGKSSEISKHLSDADDLFYFVSILDKNTIEQFLAHYNGGAKKNAEIDDILKKSKTAEELIDKLKKKITSKLTDEYQSICDEIGKRRKKGIDTYIEELRLISVPPKIKMFESTMDKKDFYKVKKILDDIMQSLKPLENSGAKNEKESTAEKQTVKK